MKNKIFYSKDNSLNLASVIERRFAHFGDFELPDIPREPLREPPMVCFQTLQSPQPPLKRGENLVKVPLLKGDLGGFHRQKRSQYSLKTRPSF